MTTDANYSENTFVNKHQDLIDLCRKNDQKAQFQIYKLYYKAMYNISLRIVTDPMEAEDIMQESFLTAFGKLDTYSGTVSFGAWIRRIVINRSIDYVKKTKRYACEDIEKIPEIADDNEDGQMANEEYDKFVSEAKKAINRLPAKKRVIASLYMLEGYDHDEIGAILSISPVTSRSQLSRAREKLSCELGSLIGN